MPRRGSAKLFDMTLRTRTALLLLLLATTAASGRVINDLPYKAGDKLTDYEKQRCKLDLYLPDDRAAKPFPIVVFFHGGGLTSGDKSGAADFGKRLATSGIIVASANYRLSPKATFPAYNEDAAAAVAWVHANAATYGGDPKRLFVSGHSAGGYLALIVGFDPALLAKYNLNPDKDLAGLIPVAPQAFTHFTIRRERGIKNPENTPTIDAAAPAFHVRKTAPPTLILVGDHDWPARVEENQYFAAMLHHLGDKDIDVQVIKDRNHGSIFGEMSKEGDPGLRLMLNFIRNHEVKSQSTRPAKD